MMMKRTLLGICFVAGCAAPPQTLEGPAISALVALPAVQFAATLDLAQQVAQGCASYAFDTTAANAVAAARSGVGAGSRAGVDIELDVSRRSFQAKHAIVVGQDDTCAAIATEVADGTAISAVLTPV